MKLLYQAAAGAIIVHVLYWMISFSIGYIKTTMHQPNIESLIGNGQVLQAEVSFGYAISPLWYVPSFFAMTLLLWGVLAVYRKAASKPGW